MKRHTIIFLAATLFMAAALVMPATAEEGITDTEIHLGTFGPLTGPAAAWGGVAYGVETMCAYINERGGIHGRKIVLHIVDDQYNPAKTKAGVKRIQESIGIFAWVSGIGTTPSLAVMDYICSKGVPWFGPCSGSEALVDPPKRNLFACYPISSREAAVLCRYAIETLGIRKIAMAYQNDPYGLNGFKGAKAEMVRQKVELVAAIPVEKRDIKMIVVANELRKSGAEAVLIWLNNLSALQVMQASRKMNFAPQWLAPISFSDFKVSYKVSRGLIEGLISDQTLKPNSPKIAEYAAAHQRLGRKGVAWTDYVAYGVAFTEAVEWVLNQCGRDLTRDKCIRQMEKLGEFDAIGGDVRYKPFDPTDPECRNGMKKVYLKQCLKDGESKILKAVSIE